MFSSQKKQFLVQCKTYKNLHDQLIQQLREQERLSNRLIAPACDSNGYQQQRCPLFDENYVIQPVFIQNNSGVYTQGYLRVLEVRKQVSTVVVSAPSTRPAPQPAEQVIEISSDSSSDNSKPVNGGYGSDTDSDRLVIDTDYESDGDTKDNAESNGNL